ncbi:MAG: adenosine deaminase [Acidobacteria bacterium 13_2_20CM_2_57_6]|nr:MAG: adenosine deaminase [Acidobacteria bacterium 13_2_20CM_57_7]OLB89255.1 MAG: adenosine deaminase [Acidobacteria bacterium 13_2_20CM_2_57_6]
MTPHSLSDRIATLPKAELHLHLEGSIQPATVCVLTARHGIVITEEEVRRRYAYRDFPEFIETFKWVTSFLREPQDYALIARDLAEHLFTQHVVYTEVTLSIGVMLLRKQQPEANFEALLRATEQFESRGLRVRWVFDAARQFGAAAAMEVVESAKRCNSKSIVAFGIGGDELSVPTKEFRGVYDRAAQLGLHRLMHAGEVGGPEKIREAIELLGAERIGHGIAAINDPQLLDFLAERKIPLEICPASNMNTGALARQLKLQNATIENHPLPKLLRHGIPVVLSTDDPAMFHTTLNEEYANAARMGLVEEELARIVEMGFEHAFSPVGEGRGA